MGQASPTVCQSGGIALQVFYYLRELDEALTYALGAGNAFDISEKSEYVSAIIGAHSLIWLEMFADTCRHRII